MVIENLQFPNTFVYQSRNFSILYSLQKLINFLQEIFQYCRRFPTKLFNRIV